MAPPSNKPEPQPDSRLILDCIAEGACCLDLDGNITFLNRAAGEMLQVDPQEIIGRNFHSTVHQPHTAVEASVAASSDSTISSHDECASCRKLLSDQGCFVNHEMFQRLNGSSFPVEYSVQPLISEHGRVGSIITFSDITARQIHSREMLYILTSAKCLLWYGDVQYVRSKKKLRWFLWPADAVAAHRFLPIAIASGQTFAEAFYACRIDKDKGDSDAFGTNAILAGRNYHQEYRCRRADGEIRWISEDVEVERVSEDRWRAVGVCTDITELKQRESEIEILNERLKRAIMETHHRVKNNLQIIVALIELQTIDRPETLPLAEFTRLSLHVRSLAAVHDLLTAEIKTTGQSDTLSARSILEQLLTTIEHTTGRAQMRYELEEVRLMSHQCAALALITNELIANAMKHGRSEIWLQFTTDNSNAILVVSDDGPGFPPGFSPHAAANTGMELIENLTSKDLAGHTRYENRAEGGARVVVEFPISTN